ncbi:MAG: IS66 family transposase [Tannerellaceae bacterium]|jgi:hypothetical protein|nr:IS66 family transposase [Tannerellaceae bacterium]
MARSRMEDILTAQLEASNMFNKQLLSQIETLSATIKSMEGTIASLREALLQKDKSLTASENKIRGISKLISNKSEKQSRPKQGQETASGEVKPKADLKARKNNGAKRDMHYELEEVVKDVYPDDTEFDIRTAIEIGIRESIRYRMVPMKFQKIVCRLHTYRQDERIFSCKAIQAPLQNSSFDGSFIAGMAQLRYIYSMPVERIIRYFNDNGFHVNKATANGLLSKTADMFENLYKALGRAVLEDDYISCDETYYKVMDKAGNPDTPNINKEYIWAISAMNLNLAYYFYENGSRQKGVIHKKLEKYKGTVQSDGYAPYKSLGDGILRLSCFQHCKRKFLDIQGNPDADRITGLINQLYREEHKHCIGVDKWTGNDNLKWRRKYSKSIMNALMVALKRIVSSPEYPPYSMIHPTIYS